MPTRQDEEIARLREEISKWITEAQLTRKERDDYGLTLATLSDMVLGENAKDRSDEALIRAVRGLLNEIERYKKRLKYIDNNINDNTAIHFAIEAYDEEFDDCLLEQSQEGDKE